MPTLEQRVSELENQMSQLLKREKEPKRSARWENIVGTFADSEGFEEAVRLGREYRKSLRPKDNEGAA